MWKTFSFLFICFGLAIHLSAQTKTVVLRGKIIDTKQKGIPFAGIQNVNAFSGVTANENGVYIFKTTLPATLKISALGFRTQVKAVNIPVNADTLDIDFMLEPEAMELQAVNISAIHKPEEIIEADNLADFEFKDNLLWLLYTNRNGDKLRVTDTSGKEIAQDNLQFAANNLHKTENGFIYSLDQDSVFVSQWDTKNFSSFSVPYASFLKQYLPIAAYHDPYYYYMQEGSEHAKIAYWYYDNSGKRKILYRFVNEDLYNSNRETYASMDAAKREWEAMGSPNNIAELRSTGPMRSTDPKFRYKNMMMEIGSIYCPMRIVRDSIYIFNFDIDSIYVFDRNNNYARRMSLTFDLFGLQYKNKNILVDEQNRNCYFEYVVNGITHLDRINLDDGGKTNSRSLTDYPFLEKILVSNGYAYFCYLDHGSSIPTRKIFRQQLD